MITSAAMQAITAARYPNQDTAVTYAHTLSQHTFKLQAGGSAHCRDFDLVYPNPSFKLALGPWISLTPKPYADCDNRYRVVGAVEASGHSYTVLQIERRCPLTFSYQSRILVGSYIDAPHAEALFHPEAGSKACQGLWCSRCFADNAAGNGMGGIDIPHWMQGRYFTSTEYVKCCGSTMQVYKEGKKLRTGRTHIFSSILNGDLMRYLELQLAPFGISTISYSWSTGPASTAPFKEELAAMVWHPRRVERWLETGGWDLVDQMVP